MTRSKHTVLAVTLVVAALGCGSDGGTSAPDADVALACGEPTGAPDTVPLRGSCERATRLGGFVVEAQKDFSFVDGEVANGVVPATVLEQVEVVGDCKLMRRRFPFCAPACSPGETCDFDGSCIAFPARQDVGTVCVPGLRKPVRLTPESGLDYFDTDLPHPAFDPGALIELSTTAGAFGELVLHGVGVDPLVVDGSLWSIADDSALAVRWEAPAAGARSQIALEINIDQHGTSPLLLECEFEDDGAADVPRELIQALLQSGVSGFPNGTLTRHTADSVEVDGGCIDLLVRAPRTVDVRVAGHTPCDKPEDCPDGQTCDTQTQTCR